MPILVQKYGGSSLATPEHIRSVARRLTASWEAGAEVIAVVSAMGSTTDRLHRLARQLSPDPPRRELDMLVSAGERVSMALLAIAIDAAGGQAVSFTGSQSGIITDTRHGDARITAVKPFRLREALDAGRIVIVAGYQGVSEAKEITTLGRGGTDLTAIALAHAFGATDVELCKDVDGVFTADPSLVPAAVCHAEIPNDALRRLAEAGAQVVYAEAVRYAKESGVAFRVVSSVGSEPGTRVVLRDLDPDVFYGVTRTGEEDDRTVTAVSGPVRTRNLANRLSGELDPDDDCLVRWRGLSDDASVRLLVAVHAPPE